MISPSSLPKRGKQYIDYQPYPNQNPTTSRGNILFLLRIAAFTTLYIMDCFGDFCLTCDAQTNGTVFCSQRCQLAELDNYSNSAPSSPVQYDPSTVGRCSSTRSSSGLYLPPAIDFSAYRTTSSKSLESFKTTRSSHRQISEQAQNDLNDYVTSFDKTRTVRRRISMH